jgi:hypothetical protein
LHASLQRRAIVARIAKRRARALRPDVLEHFPSKWMPVGRKKMRKNNKL